MYLKFRFYRPVDHVIVYIDIFLRFCKKKMVELHVARATKIHSEDKSHILTKLDPYKNNPQRNNVFKHAQGEFIAFSNLQNGRCALRLAQCSNSK
jgi:hypothetical protein